MTPKSNLHSPVFPLGNKLARVLWAAINLVFFKFAPTPFFKYRIFILKIFGAKASWSSKVYSSARIWGPWNLEIGPDSTIGPGVTVYNQDKIKLGKRVIISQGAYLCTGSHDYNDKSHPLITSPIEIEDDVWVCAESFTAPGVTLAKGTVVGARAVVTKNTEEWGVFAGNPAILIKYRQKFTY